MKKLLLPILAAMLLSGCANTGPALLRTGVSTGIAYGLRNSPNTVHYMRAVQPVICSMVTSNLYAPEALVAAIENSDAQILKTAEGVLLVNSAVLLYDLSYYSLQSTNAAKVKPYADAMCQGWSLGLAMSPPPATKFSRSTARNAPPAVPSVHSWPVVK